MIYANHHHRSTTRKEMTRSVMKSKKLKKHMKAVKFVLLKRFRESEILSTFVETTTEFNLHTKSVTAKNGKVFHLFSDSVL